LGATGFYWQLTFKTKEIMLPTRRQNEGDIPVLSRMLENFLTDAPSIFRTGFAQTSPAVNIQEKNDAYLVEVAAPGLKKEDFNVNLDNDILTISSEKEIQEEQNDRFTRKEFIYSSFERSFSLPQTTEAEKIEAKYENGILKIKIPKKEMPIKKSPKQIKIS
jgi:HSP20 family protein